MKRLYFFLLLFLPLISSGQLPLLISDNFLDNSNDWYEKDDKTVTAKVGNGIYYLYLKDEDYTYRFWNKLYDLTSLDEYKIECRMKLLSGRDDDFYGLLFDTQDAENCSEFKIASVKEAYINRREDKDYKYLTYRLDFPFINPRGQYNTLTVHKHNGYYDFYINGHFFKRLNAKKLIPQGGKVGFFLGGKMEVAVDYIKIYGRKSKINLVDNPLNSQKVNLGPGVNTGADELRPIISSDGNYLYFVRVGGDYGDDDDIWVSQKVNGQWTKAKKLPPPFNDEHNNGIYYVSPDRTVFIVSGTYDNGVYVNSDGLSVIYKNPDGTWIKPQALIIGDIRNASEYYSYCMSADRKYLLLSVEIPGDTYGKRDIYVSFLQNDGTYSTPVNLGPVVNTTGNDGTPFLASDNRTLYFYSDGHPGYGDGDIFVTRRLDDTWTNWTDPQNLGPAINSDDWDAYFTIDSRGEYAYLVSYKPDNAFGQGDIYSIRLSEEARPNPVAVINGKVIDKSSGRPVQANIIYYKGDEDNVTNTSISDAATGGFKLVLPLGQKYTIYANKPGYISSLKEIDLTDSLNYTEIPLVLNIKKISAGQTFTLKNIYFPAGSSKFLPQSYPELNRLVMFMKQNPEVKIEISGHTNNIGNRDKLLKLSLDRARAVKKYLVNAGINANRITVKGYGPDKPVADNSTVQGRRLNQRVEIKIIKD